MEYQQTEYLQVEYPQMEYLQMEYPQMEYLLVIERAGGVGVSV